MNKPVKMKPCYMCNNARIDEDLEDYNDYSCISIGSVDRYYRFMLCSGWAKPLRIELEHWNNNTMRWSLIGIYYPKYCPNCGRKIEEYEHEGTGKV